MFTKAIFGYDPRDFGGEKEQQMVKEYQLEYDDAKLYFDSCIKPRLDRSYKLYIAYNGDRAKEIKKWQANIFVPYIQAVVETLMPRILDARPEFTVQGRNSDDQLKASKLQSLSDFTWEVSGMDATSELLVRSSLIYGTGFMQVGWKKDVREHRFLATKDLAKKKYKWETREQTFYDAPFTEHVDNYGLLYDWRNIKRENKQFWFKRLVLPGSVIRRRYPMANKERLDAAFARFGSGDISDFGAIRNEVKFTHDKIVKGADYRQGGFNLGTQNAQSNDPDMILHEVHEWWRPYKDFYAVMVNGVPIFEKAFMPIPYDFKAAPFLDIAYLKLPNEFEGYGLPMILENPQIMLNMIKNQRLDSMTLNIHKMWIVNPLANINKEELVTRPFGIIYSPDPNGVREVEFSDIKASAYKEEELIKSDMRYASGVDDFSMGVGGGASSATEVRHLRESTLERVRLYVNHMGDAYSEMMRYWLCLYRQFFTTKMTIRITGEDGQVEFPLIEKDDLMGNFDFRAAVIPSIAGKNDVDKKQGMDLFQLLINLPFVDPMKLTSKVLTPWNWSLETIKKEEMPQQLPGMPGAEGMPPGMPGAEGQMPGIPEGMPMPVGQEEGPALPPIGGAGDVSSSVVKQAIAMLGGSAPEGGSPFGEAAMPIDLLQAGGLPPTAPRVPMPTSNPRGFNRSGKVNTNIPLKAENGPEAQLMNRVNNIQR